LKATYRELVIPYRAITHSPEPLTPVEPINSYRGESGHSKFREEPAAAPSLPGADLFKRQGQNSSSWGSGRRLPWVGGSPVPDFIEFSK
jgi:hypothetical protein